MSDDRIGTSGPTIHDVARRAGVSRGTVSNVINGNVPVSARRREVVAKAIAELGYFPNSLAQGLRRKQANVIGLCIPHLASGYLSALAMAIEDLAASKGFSVVQAVSRQNPDIELRRVQALLGGRVAGLILVPSSDPAASLDLLHRAQAPTVVVDRLWDDPRFDYVTMDNRRAMTDLAESLVTLGHRRLLYVVSHPGLVTTRHRIEALQETASRRGVSAATLQRLPDEAAFRASVEAALRGPEPPTAIIGSNSVVTMSLIRQLKAMRWSVPQAVSLVSFEEPDWADIVSPELAVVRHPTTEIADAALTMLLKRIGGSLIPTRHLQLNAEYRPGPSAAEPPGAASSKRRRLRERDGSLKGPQASR